MLAVSKRTIHIVLLTFTVILTLLVMYSLQVIFNPVLLALALAYILNPVVQFLEKKLRFSRKVAIGFIYVVFILIGVFCVMFILPQLYGEGKRMLQEITGEAFVDLDGNGVWDEGEPFTDSNENKVYDAGYINKFWARIQTGNTEDNPVYMFFSKFMNEKSAIEWSDNFAKQFKDAMDVLAELSGTIVPRTIDAVLSSSRAGIENVYTLCMYLILTPISLAVFLNSLDSIWNVFTRYIPSQMRPKTLTILSAIDKMTSAFFRGRFLVCAAVGIFTAIGFHLAGPIVGGEPMKYGLLFGVLVGVFSIVPFLNIVAFIPAMIILWIHDASLAYYIAMIVVYILGAQILDPILSSFILGKELSLHPLTVFISLFACGALFGFFGLLLAVPIVASVKILFRELVLPGLIDLADEKPKAPE